MFGHLAGAVVSVVYLSRKSRVRWGFKISEFSLVLWKALAVAWKPIWGYDYHTPNRLDRYHLKLHHYVPPAAQILNTSKGGQVLLLEGHRFHREYGRVGRSYWRCTKRLMYSYLKSTEIFVDALSDGSLPPKSREKYVAVYENFTIWKNTEDIKTLSEHVFLAYFEELAKKYKPSTLWCIYSMLKATVKARDDVDIKNYTNLVDYLKRLSIGFTKAKVKVLSAEHIQQFLREAPDIHYLVTKVVLIFSITGACKSLELTEITTKDIEDHGEMFLVKITDKNNKTVRTFTIHGQLYKIVKKYEELRTPKAKHDRFFQNYQKGKCTCQPIGRNKFGSMAVDIATYLGLPEPSSYTDLQSEGIFAEALNEGKLPPKSRERYVTVYENFTIWKNTANIKSFSEHVFLAYFEELAKKYKASTLWCIYSMLKATVKARDGVDIKNYSILVNYIKKLSLGFTKTKVKTLSVEQIQKFLREAPDLQYLATKVVLIFIITGRCRTLDLTEITTKDIEDRGDMFLVRITNKDNKNLRTFTIHGLLYKIVKKYEELRTPKAKHDRFFQNYQKGKCTCQPIDGHDLQTPEIFVETLSDGNLPPTSKERYVRIYDNFTNWKNSEDIKSLSEHVFLAYFEELAKKYKPSTLWCIYSMLKATVKVVLIFTITGAVKTLELTEITTKDIKDHGDMYIVKITNRNNKTVRTFTIHGQLYKIVKKYELLRTPKAKNDRFFQKYQKVYDNYAKWKIEIITEGALLAYFEEMAKKYKPSTLRSQYYMLKATVKARDVIDMKDYTNLADYLKSAAMSFTSTKPKEQETLNCFGQTTRRSLFGNKGRADIRLLLKKTESYERSLLIHGQLCQIVKKYEDPRTLKAKNNRFFLTYNKDNNFLDMKVIVDREAVLDNASDDDVIEVVRDEAPIEILSDDEEMEVEKASNLCSNDKTFNFTAPTTPNEVDKDLSNELEDPLKSCFGEIENFFSISEQEHAIAVPTIMHTMCLESDPKIDDKTNHDSSGENCFVNVTDFGNSSENDAEQLKQKVQEENESKGGGDLTLNSVNVPNDKKTVDNEANAVNLSQ
ncbi:jg8410 [Pararge aegeria aegeria]|uniref:Jg8410 protein n=1 Tax=Pararge aegeria aegeria TaxID=348720 RepID=A0A8S4SKV3_9NEOP|nr:jg8410 [Pararge aegeria aegeria]